jgi:hypothetical protein
VATFVKLPKGHREEEFEKISRIASPSKPALIPTKASPSPATVTISAQVKPNKPDQSPVQVDDPPPSRKQLKWKEEEEERKKKEEEVRRREEEVAKQEAELKRREEEYEMKQKEEELLR